MTATEEKQDLQTFTDFLQLETSESKDAIKTFLQKKPEKKDGLIDFLMTELNKSYSVKETSRFSESHNILKASKSSRKILALLKYLQGTNYSPIKKQIAEINISRIIQAIHNGVVFSGTIPTVLEISRETGISRQTVNKYFKELRYNGYFEKQITEKQILLEKAQQRLYKIGMVDNNVQALKAFIKLSPLSTPSPTNNYIQVNNLLITQEQIKQLPPEKFLQIRDILTSNSINNG